MFARCKTKITNHGFALVEILLVLIFVGAIIFAGMRLVQGRSKTPDSIFGSKGSGIQCHTAEKVNFCVEFSTTSVAASDNLNIRVTITNNGDERFSTKEQFPSSCSAPTVLINNHDHTDFGACTSDIGSVNIPPGAEKTYDFSINGTSLDEGPNDIILEWDLEKFVSKTIVVKRRAQTQADQKKFDSCLGEQSRKSYCTEVRVSFKDGFFNPQTTCKQLESYISDIGLKAIQEYCQLSDIGLLIVYVPSDKAADWIVKLNQIPQVENAF